MKRLSTKRAHFVSFIGSFVSARVFSLFLLLCFLFFCFCFHSLLGYVKATSLLQLVLMRAEFNCSQNASEKLA